MAAGSPRVAPATTATRHPRAPGRPGPAPCSPRRPSPRRWCLVVASLVLAAGCSATPGATGAPSPAAASPAPPTEPAARQQLVIHGTGDVSLDPATVPELAERGWDSAWSGLGGLFTADDLTVINLECPVSTLGEPVPDKQFTFRCTPDALPATAAAGVEVANLANNHSRDLGPDAMLDSVLTLRGAGIAAVGVGAYAAAALEPTIVDRNGWRIAVLGFGGVIPDPGWLATDTAPGMADGDDIATMTAAVAAASRRADLVVVSIHWGAELETAPQAGDVERARAMVDAGADVVFGHHAHRLQPLELYNGAPIAWGLGNFVWPRASAAGATTAVARVTVEPDGAVSACLLPATIGESGAPALDGPPACP